MYRWRFSLQVDKTNNRTLLIPDWHQLLLPMLLQKGENDDWDINAYFVMEEEPEFRIRYEVPYELFE